MLLGAKTEMLYRSLFGKSVILHYSPSAFIFDVSGHDILIQHL